MTAQLRVSAPMRAATRQPFQQASLPVRVQRAALRRAPMLRAVGDDNNQASSSTAPPATTQKQEDVPIWVRREQERELQKDLKPELPWGLYLLGSTLTAIAAVGCIFEFVDRNPFFGLIQPDSPAWAPILLTLAVTGFPTAGFLFYKGVTGFNEAAELQDKLDGYLDK